MHLFDCFVLFEPGFLSVALAVLGTHSTDSTGLELRDLPASASLMLGIKGMHQQWGLVTSEQSSGSLGRSPWILVTSTGKGAEGLVVLTMVTTRIPLPLGH